MASSGTYAFSLENADVVDEAFERCGIDPATLTGRHLRSARRSIGLLFTQFEADGVRLGNVDEQTQALTASDADYTVASGTLTILDAVIRRSGLDTPVERITREQYHQIPDKTHTGMPTMIYHDRGAGTYYLWPAPENSTDVLRYNRARMIQDPGTAAQTPDAERKWLEAIIAGLAARLAVKYAWDRKATLEGDAAKAYAIARGQDVERADTIFEVGG